MVHDVQPLMRFGIRAVAEHDGHRESGRSGGGGRMTLGYFEAFRPSGTRNKPPNRPWSC